MNEERYLLISSNNPRPPSLKERLARAISWPFQFMLWLILKIIAILLGKPFRRRDEKHLEKQIRQHLSFLFTEQRAQIIPNEDHSEDALAHVTVKVGILRFRFCDYRELSFEVASEFAPHDWQDFSLLAEAIGMWDKSQPVSNYSLENLESILRPRLETLQQALSKERFEATLNNAARIHQQNVDQYLASFRPSSVSPKAD